MLDPKKISVITVPTSGGDMFAVSGKNKDARKALATHFGSERGQSYYICTPEQLATLKAAAGCDHA